MKFHFLLIFSCVIATIAATPSEDFVRRQYDGASPHSVHKRWPNGTCTIDAQGNLAFSTGVEGLTVTGQGTGNLTSDQLYLLNIDSSGATVLNYTANITLSGVFSAQWNYGQMIGGVQDVILVTKGNSTHGSVDGRDITPFKGQNPTLTFTDGTPIPTPTIPADLASALGKVSNAVKDIINDCQLSPNSDDNNSSSAWAVLHPPTLFDIHLHSQPPRSCPTCITEAFVQATTCGIACGETLGPGCDCLAVVPHMYQGCRGIGLACCPGEITCGTLELLGHQPCCPNGTKCLNELTNRCCPTEQVCGAACCKEGEICHKGKCCSSEVCCAPRTPSRCATDAILTCDATGLWSPKPCKPPLFCLPLPVRGAGVACVGAPPGG